MPFPLNRFNIGEFRPIAAASALSSPRSTSHAEGQP